MKNIHVLTFKIILSFTLLHKGLPLEERDNFIYHEPLQIITPVDHQILDVYLHFVTTKLKFLNHEKVH